MKLVFEKIAKEEGCEYKSIDKSYLGYGLSRTPETKHYLEIVYKGHVIQINYELGNFNLGKIECELDKGTKIPDFEIIINSYFKRILNKRIQRFKVKSKNVVFNSFLQEKLASSGIEQIGRDSLFEPQMFIEKEGQRSKLVTKFHLEFAIKHKVIKPMIRLYKTIVDYC